MELKEVFELPKCKRCGHSSVYVKANGDIVCRRCGYLEKNKEVRK